MPPTTSWRPSTASAPRSPPRCASWATDPENRALIERLRDAGVRLADPEPEGVERGPAGRCHAGRHGHPRRLHPGRRPVGGRGPGRQGDGFGVEEDHCGGGGGLPGSKAAKAEDLGVPILDEAAFTRLLEEGPDRDLKPARLLDSEHPGEFAGIGSAACGAIPDDRARCARLPATPPSFRPGMAAR